MPDRGSHLGDAISALLDGELDVVDEAAVRDHLAGCDSCAAELRATQAVRAALRALPVVAPVSDLAARARRRARRERPLVWAAAAATVVALVVLAGGGQDDRSAPPVARLVEAHATADVRADPVTHLVPPALIPVSLELEP